MSDVRRFAVTIMCPKTLTITCPSQEIADRRAKELVTKLNSETNEKHQCTLLKVVSLTPS